MAGAKPGLDSTRTQTRRPAKTGRRQAWRARQAETKQKKPGTGIRGADTGADRGRSGVEMPCGVEWIQSWLPTPNLGGLGAGRNYGGGSTKIAEEE